MDMGNCETLNLKFRIVQIYEFHQIHLIVIRCSKCSYIIYWKNTQPMPIRPPWLSGILIAPRVQSLLDRVKNTKNI